MQNVNSKIDLLHFRKESIQEIDQSILKLHNIINESKENAIPAKMVRQGAILQLPTALKHLIELKNSKRRQ